MAVQAEKRRLRTSFNVPQAKKRLLEIYAAEFPGADFERDFPKVWPWLECWFLLRSRNDTWEIITQTFAEKIVSMRLKAKNLEDTIHTQRLELQKRLREIDELKAANNTTTGTPCGVQDHAESAQVVGGSN